MPRTVAIDGHVEDRGGKPVVEDTERAVAGRIGFLSQDNLLPAIGSGHQASEPAWPRRSLSDALADLGPARPGAKADIEPWNRVTPRDVPAGVGARSCPSEGGGDPGGAADAPPPMRPLRQAPTFETTEKPRPPVVDDLSHTRLSEFDAAGMELVKALAAADRARRQRNGGAVDPAGIDLDMMEPAPMIIERARAEQQLGMAPVLPAVPWANPLRGLAIGFSLSLATGAVLYMLLKGG